MKSTKSKVPSASEKMKSENSRTISKYVETSDKSELYPPYIPPKPKDHSKISNLDKFDYKNALEEISALECDTNSTTNPRTC